MRIGHLVPDSFLRLSNSLVLGWERGVQDGNDSHGHEAKHVVDIERAYDYARN
jgi:hypothetical protein